jgi:hypothetical protein
MKSRLRVLLFVLLAAAGAPASAQRHELFSPLPSGMDRAQALQVARQVLGARGWQLAQTDRDSLEARKGLSGIRISAGYNSLQYNDLTDRRHMRQRNREEGPSLAAIPQPEIDGLRADLGAAFAGRFTAVPGAEPGTPSTVLFDRIDPSLSPTSVMEAARHAFIGRRWKLTSEGEEVFVAQIRTVETDATLRVFFADGALRYTDVTNRYGEKGYTEKSRVPERWIVNLRSDIGRIFADLRRETRPAAREPAPRAAQAGDAAERLRKLKSMLDSGLITPAEYESKRAEILRTL